MNSSSTIPLPLLHNTTCHHTSCSPVPAKPQQTNPCDQGTLRTPKNSNKNPQNFRNHIMCQPETALGTPVYQYPPEHEQSLRTSENVENLTQDTIHTQCATTSTNTNTNFTNTTMSPHTHMNTNTARSVTSLLHQMPLLNVNPIMTASPPNSPRTSQGYFSQDEDIGFCFDHTPDDCNFEDLLDEDDANDDDEDDDSSSTCSCSTTYSSDEEQECNHWNRSRLHPSESKGGNDGSDDRQGETQPVQLTKKESKSSSRRTRVRFSTLLVTEVYTRPKTTGQDFGLYYYSAHELQRLMDDEKESQQPQSQPSQRCIIAAEEEDIGL